VGVGAVGVGGRTSTGAACAGACSNGDPGGAVAARGSDANRDDRAGPAPDVAIDPLPDAAVAVRVIVWAYFPLGSNVIGTERPVSDCA
jgi:hypothetical protein